MRNRRFLIYQQTPPDLAKGQIGKPHLSNSGISETEDGINCLRIFIFNLGNYI